MHRIDKVLVWFRRDLRHFDHTALHHALRQSRQVYCAFVLDKEILDPLPRQNRRVEFIHGCVSELDAELRKLGGGLIVRHTNAIEEIPRLATELGANEVFANHDYEPNAVRRNELVGIDWRRGKWYFAEKLNDYDLAANNGGWQWAASTECDAQPYFRIFNPASQSEKFDPEDKFIKRYLPSLAKLSEKALHAPSLASPSELHLSGIAQGEDYPMPIVQHDEARKRTLERYAIVKKARPTNAVEG